jgi:hypothetical protein
MSRSRSRECAQHGDHSTAHKGHKISQFHVLPCTGSGEVHGTLCISTHQHYSGPLNEIAIYEHTTRQVTPRERAWAMPAPLRPSLHRRPTLRGPGPPTAVLRLVLQLQQPDRVDLRLGAPADPGDQGPGSKAAGLALAFKLLEAAQHGWRAVNGPTWSRWCVPALFDKRVMVERPDEPVQEVAA